MECGVKLQSKYQRSVLTKPLLVFVYTIPWNADSKPDMFRTEAVAAASWDLSTPQRICNLTVLASDSDDRDPIPNKSCLIQLRDYDEDHQVYGEAVVDTFPGDLGCPSVLGPVIDSKRYFTLKIQKYSGEWEIVGLGFSHRTDSSDLTQTLQDYFASNNNSKRRKIHHENIPGNIGSRIKIEVDDPNGKSKTPIRIRPKKREFLDTIQELVDTGVAHLFRKRNDVLLCHMCPFKVRGGNDGQHTKLFDHWTDAHGLDGPNCICLVCLLVFDDEAQAAQHSQSAHNFRCPSCLKIFDGEIRLRDHMSVIHNQTLQYKCQGCSLTFFARSDLRAHSKETGHPGHAESIDKNSLLESAVEINYAEAQVFQRKQLNHDFQCPHCHATCAKESRLQKHVLKVHNQILQCKCEACSIIFYTRSEFTEHREIFH